MNTTKGKQFYRQADTNNKSKSRLKKKLCVFWRGTDYKIFNKLFIAVQTSKLQTIFQFLFMINFLYNLLSLNCITIDLTKPNMNPEAL